MILKNAMEHLVKSMKSVVVKIYHMKMQKSGNLKNSTP